MKRVPPHADHHPALDQLVEGLRSQRRVEGASYAQRRFAMEALQSQLPLPPGIELQQTRAGQMPGTWFRSEDARPDAAILYLHGGGYVLGSTVTHRELMARLAISAETPLLGLDYRLAPEDPFPAALEDAVAAYRWLLARGFDPDDLVLGGDSAGGGLALATLLRLRDAGDPLPAGAILLSPWTDLTASGGSTDSRADDDPMVRLERLREMARAYAAGRLDEPLVSPLFADLSGLPPLLAQVGDAEVLLDDSVRLAQRLEDQGGKVELEVWERMPHVFQAFPQLEEAHQAVGRLGSWARSRAGGA